MMRFAAFVMGAALAFSLFFNVCLVTDLNAMRTDWKDAKEKLFQFSVHLDEQVKSCQLQDLSPRPYGIEGDQY